MPSPSQFSQTASLRGLSKASGLRSAIVCADLQAREEVIITGDAGGRVACHTLAGAEPIWRIKEGWGPVNFIVKGPDNAVIIGCGKGIIAKIGIEDGLVEVIFQTPIDAPLCGAYVPSLRVVLVGFASGYLKSITLTGEVVSSIYVDQAGGIVALAVNEANASDLLLAVGTDRGVLLVVDGSITPVYRSSLGNGTKAAILCITFAPPAGSSGPAIVVATEGGSLATFYVGRRAPAVWGAGIGSSANPHRAPITGMSFVSSSDQLCTVDVEGLVCTWDWANQRLLAKDLSHMGTPMLKPIHVPPKLFQQTILVSVDGNLVSNFTSYLNSEQPSDTQLAPLLAVQDLEATSRQLLEEVLLSSLHSFAATVDFYDRHTCELAERVFESLSPPPHRAGRSLSLDRTTRLTPPPVRTHDMRFESSQNEEAIRRLEDALLQQRRDSERWAGMISEESQREVKALRQMLHSNELSLQNITVASKEAQEEVAHWRRCFEESEQQRTKLLADVKAIRAPWAAMKSAIQESSAELEAAKLLHATEREALENVIEDLSDQVAGLKRAIRSEAFSDGNDSDYLIHS